MLSDLVGRPVHDVDGRRLGRLEELRAEVQLCADGVDYVVVEYHVGAYGALEAMGGSHFARHFARLFASVIDYRRYRVPWEWMDLADPRRPVVTRPMREIPVVDD